MSSASSNIAATPVSIQAGDVAFVGVIDAIGRDYVQLRTDGGRVDIALSTSATDREPLPVLVRVISRAREGGRRAEADAATFRARLLEYDADEIEAIVGSVITRDELRGCLIVGRDHVVVHDRDGGDAYVPLPSIAWVKPWREWSC